MSGLRGRRGGRAHSLFRGHSDTNGSGGASFIPQIERTVHANLSRTVQIQFEKQPPESPPTQNSSVGSSHTFKKGRGVYKSTKVDPRTKFSKIRVQLSDSVTRAVGSEARHLANYCGLIVKKTISLRHSIKWKHAFEEYGKEMILKVKDKFEPVVAADEGKFEQTVINSFQNAFRGWKTNLLSHYKTYDTDEDRLANPPENVTLEDWEWLLTYFKSDNFKKKNVTNQQNRGNQVTKHTCGPQSFAEVDFSIVRMKELVQGNEVESDVRMTSDEILVSVFGERSSYVRGKGYGGEPPKKKGRTQSSQNSLEHMRTQLQEEFDKKIQEEREKMEVNLAAERAKMEANLAAERAKMEEECAQFEERMEQRMQAQLTAFMTMLQSNVSTPIPAFDVP